MTGHVNETRLHDYGDGLLQGDELRAVEVHLAECAPCQDELAALKQLLEAVGDLPTAARPSRDLWGGIEARIGAAEQPADEGSRVLTDQGVVSLDAHRDRIQRRSVTLTVNQLLAAGIVLAALSGATVWGILGSSDGAAPTVAQAPGGAMFASTAVQ